MRTSATIKKFKTDDHTRDRKRSSAAKQLTKQRKQQRALKRGI